MNKKFSGPQFFGLVLINIAWLALVFQAQKARGIYAQMKILLDAQFIWSWRGIGIMTVVSLLLLLYYVVGSAERNEARFRVLKMVMGLHLGISLILLPTCFYGVIAPSFKVVDQLGAQPASAPAPAPAATSKPSAEK